MAKKEDEDQTAASTEILHTEIQSLQNLWSSTRLFKKYGSAESASVN